MLLRRISLLLSLFLFGFVGPGYAMSIDELQNDFQPLSGYVIMIVEDEYLIDLDASKGVKPGDLFTVIREGEKIIHPITNEVLGTLDEVKGVLEVTRVKSGYSYARLVRSEQPIARGDKVRRYTDLSAIFWDYSEAGEPVYARIKEALPGLEWRGYDAAQATRPAAGQTPEEIAADLVFLLKPDRLEVRDADLRVLAAYPRPTTDGPAAGSAPSPPPAPARADSAGSRAATPPAPPTAIPSTPGHTAETAAVRWEETPAASGVGYEASFPGFAQGGQLPSGTVMADFVQTPQGLLIATTDSTEIRVFTAGDPVQEVARGDTNRPGKILSVHWWQPAPGGPLFLAATFVVDLNQAVTSYIGNKAVGAVFRLEGNRLLTVREGLPYMLGAFDRDGDGSRETLLGQEFDRDIFFGQIKQLQLRDDEFHAQEPSFFLPLGFSVQGSTFADLTGDGFPETVWVRNRVLNIYRGEEHLYESTQSMGGTLSQMEYSSSPGAKEADIATAAFEVPPVARDLDGDGQPELIAIATEGDFLRAPGIGPGIKKSWLAVFKYRNGMFVKGKIGEEVERVLQGLYVSADRAYFVATAPSSWLGKPGKSHLLAFPLK